MLDDCCPGLLAVSIDRIFRTTDPFPIEVNASTTDSRCAEHPIAVALLVSLFRCIPTIDAKGRPPSPERQEQAALGLYTDAAILWRALVSADMLDLGDEDSEPWERAAVSVTFTEPLGGCQGVEGRITVGIDSIDWCLACPPEAPELAPEPD